MNESKNDQFSPPNYQQNYTHLRESVEGSCLDASVGLTKGIVGNAPHHAVWSAVVAVQLAIHVGVLAGIHVPEVAIVVWLAIPVTCQKINQFKLSYMTAMTSYNTVDRLSKRKLMLDLFNLATKKASCLYTSTQGTNGFKSFLKD